MHVREYNRGAWDHEVERKNRWTVPVGPEQVAAARRGEWQIVLTPLKPVPRGWFPDPLAGREVLCLACGGGQQGPILAAAGARVTVLDNSPGQLAQDRLVAEREGLEMRLVEGDMADLSAFAGQSFDLVFHPVSNLFAEKVRPVWAEAFRVLRPGGTLLAAFANPAMFVFDGPLSDQGVLQVRHSLPYADTTSLTPEELQELVDRQEPLQFGHSLEDQIGGQLDAGFALVGLYEDGFPGHPLEKYMPPFIATRAVRPA